MPTIIYPSPVDFKWMFQRPQQLLINMSLLGYNCIFIDPGIRIKQEDMEKINNNFLLINKQHSINYKKLSKPIILFESYPPEHNLNKLIPHDILIFDCIDFPGEQFEHWRENFDCLSENADIIICSSQGLCNLQKKYAKKIHIIRNGADFQYFKKADTVPNNKIKQVGFIGSVAPWLDYDLIDYIIKKNSDKQFVFVGDFYDIKPNFNYSNAVFTGRKDYKDLIKYMRNMDAFINPFKITTMTNCVSPIKLYEYLSTGKPVVSTAILEVVPLDRDYVYVGKNYEQFNTLLNMALKEDIVNKRQDRQRYAYQNSWIFRARDLDEIIKNYR
jgi:glycosyltransferase involved in cell wall biosynthesis